MKFSKKDLLSLLNENIDEMAMNFDTNDRPNDDLQNKLQQGDTPLKKVPFPKTGQEPNQNFQEILASERYKQVVANVRRYTNYQGNLNGTGGMMPLHQMMYSAYQRIDEIETLHKQTITTLGASKWQTITSVFFPAVISKLMDDIRVLVAISWTYIIFAEMSNKSTVP